MCCLHWKLGLPMQEEEKEQLDGSLSQNSSSEMKQHEEIVEVVKGSEGEDDFDEEDLASNAILDLQAIREQPTVTKTFSEEENKKWSYVCWPSNIAEAFNQSHDMAELKSKLTTNKL